MEHLLCLRLGFVVIRDIYRLRSQTIDMGIFISVHHLTSLSKVGYSFFFRKLLTLASEACIILNQAYRQSGDLCFSILYSHNHIRQQHVPKRGQQPHHLTSMWGSTEGIDGQAEDADVSSSFFYTRDASSVSFFSFYFTNYYFLQL